MFLYGDTFDTYATADLAKRYPSYDSSGSRTTISAGTGRGGTNSLRLQIGYVKRGIPSSNSATRIVHVASNVIDPAGGAFCYFRNAVNSRTHLSFIRNTNGSISVWRGSLLGTTPPGLVSIGTYAHIGLKVFVASDDHSGTVAIYVNGALVLNLSGIQTTDYMSQSSVDEIQLGGDTYAYIDDFIISDNVDNGDGCTDFLGDLIGERLPILLDGATMDWTPNTGTGHAAVDDDTPDGDTTTIASNTLDQRALFTHGALTRIDNGIKCVQLSTVGKKTTGGTRALKHTVRISSTNYDGASDIYLPTDYETQITPFPLNPATSTGWLAAAVDGSQIGTKVSV